MKRKFNMKGLKECVPEHLSGRLPGILIIAVFLFALLSAGCSGKTNPAADIADTANAANAVESASGAMPSDIQATTAETEASDQPDIWPGDENRIVLKLASTLNPEMMALNALRGFSEEVFRETSGRIDIQIYDSSSLGDQVEYLSGIRQGTVEMCLVSTAALEAVDPHFVIFGMPGLFTSAEKVNRFYESDICRELLDRFRQESGIRSLALFHDGVRNVWLREARVYRAEDFSGLRLRIPAGVRIREKEFQALKAEVVPLPLSDCSAALQSGYIDGLENNVETIVNSDMISQIHYQIKTEHAYSTLLLLINEKALMQIDENDRNILTDCARKYSRTAFEQYMAGQEAAYSQAEKAGIETIEPEEKEQRRIRQLLLSATKEMLEGIFPEGFYEKVDAL